MIVEAEHIRTVVPRGDQTSFKDPPELCCKVLCPVCAVWGHEGCTSSCCVACAAGCLGFFPGIAYTVCFWDPKPILKSGAEPPPPSDSIDAFLCTHSAEVLKPEFDALGAQTVHDLHHLDDEDMEALVTAANSKLKKLKAKAFIRALGAQGSDRQRRKSSKHHGAEGHHMHR